MIRNHIFFQSSPIGASNVVINNSEVRLASGIRSQNNLRPLCLLPLGSPSLPFCPLCVGGGRPFCTLVSRSGIGVESRSEVEVESM